MPTRKQSSVDSVEVTRLSRMEKSTSSERKAAGRKGRPPTTMVQMDAVRKSTVRKANEKACAVKEGKLLFHGADGACASAEATRKGRKRPSDSGRRPLGTSVQHDVAVFFPDGVSFPGVRKSRNSFCPSDRRKRKARLRNGFTYGVHDRVGHDVHGRRNVFLPHDDGIAFSHVLGR